MMKLVVSALSANLLVCSISQGETLQLGVHACASRQTAEQSNAMMYARVQRHELGCMLVPKGAVVTGYKDDAPASFVYRGVRLYAPWVAVNP